MINLGFLSKQTEEKSIKKIPEKVEKVKSEVEQAQKELSSKFEIIIREGLKRYGAFIGLEHIQKAFNQAVIKVNEKIDKHNDKLEKQLK